jgi:4-aminobutyrate aminotransferase / (S)-3-amino-2-methylpropionate transaminase / 5-aminovalerate transaminase
LFPVDPNYGSGQEPPQRVTRGLGPETRSWLVRQRHVFVPMGPQAPEGSPPFGTVLVRGYGCNVWDADGNRYVDLAAGFGSMLLGHGNPYVLRALELQGPKLLQAMGDLYASDARIGLSQQLSELYPERGALVMLGQSGADVVSAALKTAMLHSNRAGVVAFDGAYHGLSYGPLAACGLRESYREPFRAQLNSHVRFLPQPTQDDDGLAQLEVALAHGDVGALLFEPIQGRAGVRIPPHDWVRRMLAVAKRYGVVTIADEIWTGLGRCGQWFSSFVDGDELVPDLICLGKGLGGGLPLSALIGRKDVLKSWSRPKEVVHTSTFAGAPLACATAVATLDVVRRFSLPEQSAELGRQWRDALRAAFDGLPVTVRGSGLMLGIDLGQHPNAASRVVSALLEAGYLVSTGGTDRQVVVLTPPLVAERDLLFASIAPMRDVISRIVAT